MKCMKTLEKRIILVVFSAMLAGPVQAGFYDDGLVAYSNADYRKATNFFLKSAEAGEKGAEHMLARIYSETRSNVHENQRNTQVIAFEWVFRAAMKGLMQSQFEVAERFEKGYGTVADNRAAGLWYRKAASQGHHVASLRLAEMISRGDIAQETHREAEVLFDYAAAELDVFAQKGDALSQTLLAGMYERGQGVDRSVLMAVAWYQKAAVQQYAAAEYHLGRLYAGTEHLDGLDENRAEALYWLKRAAQQNQPEARVLLSAMTGGAAPDVALGD